MSIRDAAASWVTMCIYTFRKKHAEKSVERAFTKVHRCALSYVSAETTQRSKICAKDLKGEKTKFTLEKYAFKKGITLHINICGRSRAPVNVTLNPFCVCGKGWWRFKRDENNRAYMIIYADDTILSRRMLSLYFVMFMGLGFDGINWFLSCVYACVKGKYLI